VEEFEPWDFFPWPQYSDVKCPVNSNGDSNYTFFDVAQGLVLVTEKAFLIQVLARCQLRTGTYPVGPIRRSLISLCTHSVVTKNATSAC